MKNESEDRPKMRITKAMKKELDKSDSESERIIEEISARRRKAMQMLSEM